MVAFALDKNSEKPSQSADQRTKDANTETAKQSQLEQSEKKQNEVKVETKHQHARVEQRAELAQYVRHEQIEEVIFNRASNASANLQGPQALLAKAVVQNLDALTATPTASSETEHDLIFAQQMATGKKKAAGRERQGWIAQHLNQYKTILPDDTIEKLAQMIERGDRVSAQTLTAIVKDISTQLKGNDTLLALFTSQSDFREGLADYLAEQIEKKLQQKNFKQPEKSAQELKLFFADALAEILDGLSRDVSRISEQASALATERGRLLALPQEPLRAGMLQEIDRRVSELRKDARAFARLGLDSQLEVTLQQTEARERYLTVSEEIWKLGKSYAKASPQNQLGLRTEVEAQFKLLDDLLNPKEPVAAAQAAVLRLGLKQHFERALDPTQVALVARVSDMAVERYFTNFHLPNDRSQASSGLSSDQSETRNAIALISALSAENQLVERVSEIDRLSLSQWRALCDRYQQLEGKSAVAEVHARISGHLEKLEQQKKSHQLAPVDYDTHQKFRENIELLRAKLEPFLLYQPQETADLRQRLDLLAKNDKPKFVTTSGGYTIPKSEQLALSKIETEAQIVGSERGRLLAMIATPDAAQKERISALELRMAELKKEAGKDSIRVEVKAQIAEDKARFEAVSEQLWVLSRKLEFSRGRPDEIGKKLTLEHYLLSQELWLSQHNQLRPELLAHQERAIQDARVVLKKARDAVGTLVSAFNSPIYIAEESGEIQISKSALTVLDGNQEHRLLVNRLFTESTGQLLRDRIEQRGVGEITEDQRVPLLNSYTTQGLPAPAAQKVDSTSSNLYFSRRGHDLDLINSASAGNKLTASPESLRLILEDPNRLLRTAESLKDLSQTELQAALKNYSRVFGSEFLTDYQSRLNLARTSDSLELELAKKYLAGEPASHDEISNFALARAQDLGQRLGMLTASGLLNQSNLEAINREASAFRRSFENVAGFESTAMLVPDFVRAKALHVIDDRYRFLQRENLIEERLGLGVNRNRPVRTQLAHFDRGISELTGHSTVFASELSPEALKMTHEQVTQEVDRSLARASEIAREVKKGEPEAVIAALEVGISGPEGRELVLLAKRVFEEQGQNFDQFISSKLQGVQLERAMARYSGERYRAYAADACYYLEKTTLGSIGLRGPSDVRDPAHLKTLLTQFKTDSEFEAFHQVFNKEFAGRFVVNQTSAQNLEQIIKASDFGQDQAVFEALSKNDLVVASAYEIHTMLANGTEGEYLARAMIEQFGAVTAHGKELDRKKIKQVAAYFDQLNGKGEFNRILASFDGDLGGWLRAAYLGKTIEARAYQLGVSIHSTLGADVDQVKSILSLPVELQHLASKYEIPLQRIAERRAYERSHKLEPTAAEPHQGLELLFDRLEQAQRERIAVLQKYAQTHPEFRDVAGVRKEITRCISNPDQRREVELLLEDGYLPIEEQLYQAMHYDRAFAIGKDKEAIREIFIERHLSKTQIDEVAQRYQSAHPGRNLRQDLAWKLSGNLDHDVLYVFDHGSPQSLAERSRWVLELKRYETNNSLYRICGLGLELAKTKAEQSDRIRPYVQRIEQYSPEKIFSRIAELSNQLDKGETLSAQDRGELASMVMLTELGLGVYRDKKEEIAADLERAGIITVAVASVPLTMGASAPSLAATATYLGAANLAVRAGVHQFVLGEAYDADYIVHDFAHSTVDAVGLYGGGRAFQIVDRYFANTLATQVGMREIQAVGKSAYRYPGNIIATEAQQLDAAARAIGLAKINQSLISRVPYGAVRGAPVGALVAAYQSGAYTALDEQTWENGLVSGVSNVALNSAQAVQGGFEAGLAFGAVTSLVTPRSVLMGKPIESGKVDDLLEKGELRRGRFASRGRGETALRSNEIEELKALRNQGDGQIRLGDVEARTPLTSKETDKLFKDLKKSNPEGYESLRQRFEQRGGYLTPEDLTSVLGRANQNSYLVKVTDLKTLEKQLEVAQTEVRRLSKLADSAPTAESANADELFEKISKAERDVERLQSAIDRRLLEDATGKFSGDSGNSSESYSSTFSAKESGSTEGKSDSPTSSRKPKAGKRYNPDSWKDGEVSFPDEYGDGPDFGSTGGNGGYPAGGGGGGSSGGSSQGTLVVKKSSPAAATPKIKQTPNAPRPQGEQAMLVTDDVPGVTILETEAPQLLEIEEIEFGFTPSVNVPNSVPVVPHTEPQRRVLPITPQPLEQPKRSPVPMEFPLEPLMEPGKKEITKPETDRRPVAERGMNRIKSISTATDNITTSLAQAMPSPDTQSSKNRVSESTKEEQKPARRRKQSDESGVGAGSTKFESHEYKFPLSDNSEDPNQQPEKASLQSLRRRRGGKLYEEIELPDEFGMEEKYTGYAQKKWWWVEG